MIKKCWFYDKNNIKVFKSFQKIRKEKIKIQLSSVNELKLLFFLLIK